MACYGEHGKSWDEQGAEDNIVNRRSFHRPAHRCKRPYEHQGYRDERSP